MHVRYEITYCMLSRTVWKPCKIAMGVWLHSVVYGTVRVMEIYRSHRCVYRSSAHLSIEDPACSVVDYGEQAVPHFLNGIVVRQLN